MLGLGNLRDLFTRILNELHETNTRLLGMQIKLDTLIEQNKPIVIETPPSPYLDKDGLYNYQAYKKNKATREDEQ